MNHHHKTEPGPFTRTMNWAGVSEKRQQSLRRLIHWFKEPSNIISVLAIIAVVVVPLIEKRLRADEDLRTKTDSVVELTSSVVAMNKQRMPSAGAEVASDAILSAQRKVKLARADAIASSIQRDLDPAVLFALAGELCASGDFERAHLYLREVLRRGRGIDFWGHVPSDLDLAEAHSTSAHCYALEHEGTGKTVGQFKNLADAEMSAAVALLQHDQRDYTLGQLAIIYTEWAQVDEQIGDFVQGQKHRNQARETEGKMRVHDPMVTRIVIQAPPKSPAFPVTLNEGNLPRSPDGETYLATFPEEAELTEVVILPRPDPRSNNSMTGLLYVYSRGLLTGVYDVFAVHRSSNGATVVALDFVEDLPIEEGSDPKPRVELAWTIEKFANDLIAGVESRIGKPPRRFLAKLSPNPSGNQIASK